MAYKVIKFVSWLVYAVVTFAIIVIAFGFFLLMFGAKPTGFAETIYTVGSDFMNPFKGMIPPTTLENGGAISWNALFAIAAYAVLAAIMGSLVRWSGRRAKRASVPVAPVQTRPPAASPQPVQPTPAASAAPAPQTAQPTPAAPADAPVPEAPAAPEPPADPGQAT